MASLDLDDIGTLNLEIRKQDTANLDVAMDKPGSYIAITGATGTTTITVTCTQSFTAGEYVHIKNVSGMTDINGTHQITARDATTFTIVLSAATSQTYIANGTAAEYDTAYDLSSGFTAKLDVKADKTGAADLSLTNGSGITLGNGTVGIEMTSAQTDTLAAGTYYYDFEITETSTGVVTTLFEGTITMIQDVSN
jgi:hypothetical protein